MEQILKNIPKVIYLQLGDDTEALKEAGDFNKLNLECVCWCANKVDDNDPEYRLVETPPIADSPVEEDWKEAMPMVSLILRPKSEAIHATIDWIASNVVQPLQQQVTALQAENKTLRVQNSAYKTSQDLAVKFKIAAEEKARHNQAAADSLESEREMNATLTEENEKLQAENQRLREQLNNQTGQITKKAPKGLR